MEPDIKKIAKELEEFFEITAPKIDLTLLYSREEYDKIWGGKSEPWQAGLTKNNKIYAIHPDKLEEFTIHKKDSHPKRVKHEIVHLFYSKCTGGCLGPVWLNEGLAYYLAGQSKHRLDESEKLKIFDYFYKNYDGKVYGPGEFMVRTLIEKFGKDKLLLLIKQLRPWMDKPEFNELFKQTYGFDFTKKELKMII